MNHTGIDQRSLAFGRAIADLLTARPELIEFGRANRRRWLPTASPGVRATLLEWLAILDGSIEHLIEVLVGTDERSTRLRQSNPFAGLLSPQVRNEIIVRYRHHDPSAA